MSKLSLRLNLFLAIGLCCVLQGCGNVKPDNRSTSFPTTAEKPLPYNPLLNGSFTPLRQDSFYATYIDRNGKKETFNDRFVSNGKGFVSYCQNEGFDDGYYLYNFYGHSSFYVLIKDRTYKVAMTSPGDDILLAYQVQNANLGKRVAVGAMAAKKLQPRDIDGVKCWGFSYTAPDGAKHEEWFDLSSRRLVEQTVERPGEKISRNLKRFNTFCDTMLLRLPEGYALEK